MTSDRQLISKEPHEIQKSKEYIKNKLRHYGCDEKTIQSKTDDVYDIYLKHRRDVSRQTFISYIEELCTAYQIEKAHQDRINPILEALESYNK